MRVSTFLLIGAALTLGGGCSNDSGTSGPQVMAVELSVRVLEPLHAIRGATVQVQNQNAVTDTSGLAVFHTDINSLVPNHTYTIQVIAATFIQVSPEGDTIRIPSSPNEPSGYVLQTTVFMRPQQDP
jgi:hypothetical protein